MNTKPVLIFAAPVASRSGYGEHSRDILRSLIKINNKTNRYDIKVLPLRWGITPLNALLPGKDDDILNLILKTNVLDKKPDVSIQLTVPNEFNTIANFNIGITAGIETTLCSPEWLEGLNRMDFNIVPSKFSEKVFKTTVYTKNIDNVKSELRLNKPMYVLFEGVDLNQYGKNNKRVTNIKFEINKIKEDFLFLFVGHWLQGELGADRKNVGMLIKVFLETFKTVPNTVQPPALLLKTGSTFSKIEKEELKLKINLIRNSIELKDNQILPNIYVVVGDLSADEMNSLYNHTKVKSHITFTRGEGFCRPLLEASLSEKIIIAPMFSGYLDFLPSDKCILLPGTLEQIHPSAVWKGVIEPESQWFTVNYSVAANSMMHVWKNYSSINERAKLLELNTINNFSLDKMTEEFEKILNNIPIITDIILPEMILPEMESLNVGAKLPKLIKIDNKNE